LRKITSNNYRREFYKQRFTKAAILLTAVLCAITTIVGISYARGSRIPMLSATVPGSTDQEMSPSITDSSSQWETVTMRVTAYCACRRCCGKFADGKTANGHKIRRNDVFVAADKIYPFGTEMIIPGYNNGEPVKVFDRGRVIRGNRLDVFFNSHKTARKWGVKYLEVKLRPK
jgi:3D (Asp-Asp-Asp) domain-containing protein